MEKEPFESNNTIPINFSDLTIIVIVIIIGISVIYKLFLQSASKHNYYLQGYWERRYHKFDTEFDWYSNFQKISKDFGIDEVLKQKFPNKKTSKILELGCGTSDIAPQVIYN